MKYKVEMSLYRVYVEESGKCSLDTHIVRTIRGGFVYTIEKVKGITWIKKSKKIGDFGWSNNISYLYRDKIKVGDSFLNLHTTKLSAYRYTLKKGLRYTDEPEKAKANIKRNITRLLK